MLNENIKKYRKEKGFSQETLAQELNVVRQTVSKWEKGLSVPDAEMLTKISDVLEIPVMTLLGGTEEPMPEKLDNSAVAAQLYILNNQFAKELYRRRKVRRTVLIVFLCLLILPVILCPLFMARRVSRIDDTFTVVDTPSEIFTAEEIDSATDTVIAELNSWKRCYVRKIGYAGDDVVNKEMKASQGLYKPGEFIIIKTDFYVAPHGGDGSLNTDYTYTDWLWFLVKAPDGNWVIGGFGY